MSDTATDDLVGLSEDQPLRVSAGSNPQSVASAIAHAVYEHKTVRLRAIGAGAINQAVKGIAIARGYVAPRGYDLVCKPGFTTVQSRDGEVSALVFVISIT
jgi:stage V sporulation protein S